MRFVSRLLAGFAVMMLGLWLMPKLVFADSISVIESNLSVCTQKCYELDALGRAAEIPACVVVCEQAAKTATDAIPAQPVDRSAGTFDQIVGANGEPAIGLIFLNICSSAKGSGQACACRDSGQCSVDDILQVFVNITILILGIIGSIVLLMFVYGGFLWVTSRGDSKRVEKGKETITQAVIGFAIVVLSYSMINFLIAALAGDEPASTLEETIDNAGNGTPDANKASP